MSEIEYKKSLIGKEDLLLGFGIVNQTRGNSTLPITKINSDNLPYDNNLSIKAKIDTGLELRNSVSRNTIADLKLENGLVFNTIHVLGYHTPGDGGGGIFYWDSTSIESDNGGTIIQATDITTGRWKRPGSGTVNVKEFGATGLGIVSDSSYIQSAINYVESQSISASGSGIGSISIPTLFVPKGKYLIPETLSVGSVFKFESEKAIFYEPTKTIPIMDVVGYRNFINDIIFDGGLYHVRVIGPNVDTMQVFMNGCEHKSVGDVYIFHDLSVNHGAGSENVRTGFSMEQVITNFKSYADDFGRFSCDRVTIDKGWAQYRPYLDNTNTGDHYWVETINGPITCDNVLGVSVHDGSTTDLSFWFKLGKFSSGNTATLSCKNTRFGEAGSAIVKADNATFIELDTCAIYGRAGNQYGYIEIYNNIPTLKITNCKGWTDSLGILIDNVTIPSIESKILVRSEELYIDINNNESNGFRDNMIVHSTRSAYKGSGLATPLVNNKFASFIIDKNIVNINNSKNLFTDQVYSLAQGSFANMTVSGVSSSSTESSTGYGLPIFVCGGDGGAYGRSQNSWGATEAPAGVYCCSILVKTDKPISLQFVRKSKPFKDVKITTLNTYVTISAVFYHDGTSGQLGFQFYNIPVSTTFVAGLPQVNAGVVPSKYAFPFAEVGEYVPVIMYGTAAPTIKTFKKGDIVYNTNPIAGGFIGWICTTAGTPGTWKTFGAITA